MLTDNCKSIFINPKFIIVFSEEKGEITKLGRLDCIQPAQKLSSTVKLYLVAEAVADCSTAGANTVILLLAVLCTL